jgi:hypothetical protein
MLYKRLWNIGATQQTRCRSQASLGEHTNGSGERPRWLASPQDRHREDESPEYGLEPTAIESPTGFAPDQCPGGGSPLTRPGHPHGALALAAAGALLANEARDDQGANDAIPAA